MANEIHVLLQLLYRRRGVGHDIVRAASLDLDSTHIQKGVRTIAITETTIALPFRTEGIVWLRNLEPEGGNYVQVRPSTGADPVIRLAPRQFAFFRAESIVSPLFLIANGASVKVEFLLLPGTLSVFLEEETSLEIDPIFIFEEDGVTPIAVE